MTFRDLTCRLSIWRLILTDNNTLILGLHVFYCLRLIGPVITFIINKQRAVVTSIIYIWSFTVLNLSLLRNVMRFLPDLNMSTYKELKKA